MATIPTASIGERRAAWKIVEVRVTNYLSSHMGKEGAHRKSFKQKNLMMNMNCGRAPKKNKDKDDKSIKIIN